jgi:hypothetical protein
MLLFIWKMEGFSKMNFFSLSTYLIHLMRSSMMEYITWVYCMSQSSALALRDAMLARRFVNYGLKKT